MNVTERFLKYVSFETASDEHSDTCPSTACQKLLAQALADELRSFGLSDVCLDENGYVYASLPASPGCEDEEALGFIAHMDTSPAVSGKNIHPQIYHYTGGDIPLGTAATLSPEQFPSLERYIGQDIITTDGTTLLGADDKAGVAEIMTLLEELCQNPSQPHRALSICFTPDEEIGRGTDRFDFRRFSAPRAYTVDGGEIGEIEYENFNAASALLTIHGVNIHPGSAKGKMKNAILLAGEWISRMPAAETPAHTEGYEGFYHIGAIEGNESEVTLEMILRDHDRALFEKRKAFVTNLAAYLNSVYGEGTFELTVKDSYYNMKEKILPHMDLIHRAEAALRSTGVTPQILPIRGGTDGARLSYEGLPCPNLCTGGANFHSIHEFIPVPSLKTMVQVLHYLAAPTQE